jgi:hypothetical protein
VAAGSARGTSAACGPDLLTVEPRPIFGSRKAVPTFAACRTWTTGANVCTRRRPLAAAKRRTELNAAAKRYMLAKAELKRLEAESAERPKRRASGGSGSAGAS